MTAQPGYPSPERTAARRRLLILGAVWSAIWVAVPALIGAFVGAFLTVPQAIVAAVCLLGIWGLWKVARP